MQAASAMQSHPVPGEGSVHPGQGIILVGKVHLCADKSTDIKQGVQSSKQGGGGGGGKRSKGADCTSHAGKGIINSNNARELLPSEQQC